MIAEDEQEQLLKQNIESQLAADAPQDDPTGVAPPPDYAPADSTPISVTDPDVRSADPTSAPAPAPTAAPEPAPAPTAAPAPATTYGAIQGFDSGKLNDTAYSSGKYTPAVRTFSAFLGSGGQIARGNLTGAVQYATANGFPNAKAVGDDKIDFGDGNGPIDVIQSNGSVWFQNGADRFAQGGAPAGYNPQTNTIGGGLPTGPNAGGFAGSSTSSPFNDQIRQLLMQRLGQAGMAVDPNDPTIAATMSAARDEATRAADTERARLAESLYAQGGGGLETDAINQKIQQSGEKNALGLSSLKATLMQRELLSRRDELQRYMQMAMASGDSESARQIQLQLADLEAELRREGYGVSLAEFGQNQNAMAGSLFQ